MAPQFAIRRREARGAIFADGVWSAMLPEEATMSSPFQLSTTEGSVAVVAGDVICSADDPSDPERVVKALAPFLARAGTALGIAASTAGPGEQVAVTVSG